MCARIFVILLLALCSAATNAAAQNVFPCLKPWTIPDKWIDNHDDPNDHAWTVDDTFETVDSHGNPLTDADEYAAPSAYAYGTGFSVLNDIGRPVTLKLAEPREGVKSGRSFAIDIGAAGGGGNAYRTAIATCQETAVHIGDSLQPLSGNLNGPTVQGVADLINLDPNATWDAEHNSVINSCAPAESASPRIVAIAVFDPAMFEATLMMSGQPQLVVTNVIGVFIDGVVGGRVTGYLTRLPTVGPDPCPAQ
jgi:hypothetical protein